MDIQKAVPFRKILLMMKETIQTRMIPNAIAESDGANGVRLFWHNLQDQPKYVTELEKIQYKRSANRGKSGFAACQFYVRVCGDRKRES